MKAAVYAGTRNLYSNMITAAKSLAINSSVDKIWFLIEDPIFPEKLPSYIQCLNVSRQKFFGAQCPNVYKLWTWMVLMRVALPKIFPEYDRILSLDVDTIINHNIDELWDLPLDDYYLAGVAEPKKSKYLEPYINAGVMMVNNKKFISDKMDDKVIASLNKDRFPFPDQDCLNLFCKGKILTIPSIYNLNDWTEYCEDPKIIHFAGDRNYTNRSIFQLYRDIPWSKIRS